MSSKLYTTSSIVLSALRQHSPSLQSINVLSNMAAGIRKFSLFSHEPEDAESKQQPTAISRISRRVFKPMRLFSRLLLYNKYLWAKYKAVGSIDPQVRKVLHSAAAQLCYDCANRYPYKALCKAFGLEDYFSTWFKLTLMHTWMVLLRLQQSLDAKTVFKIREEMLLLMWEDIDKRLKVVGKEIGINLRNRKDVLKMHGLYVQTLVEYDEGFLSSDHVFAGAIWRCLYIQRNFDPIYINAVIHYIRGTMAYLNSLDVESILINGIKEWKIASPSKVLMEDSSNEYFDQAVVTCELSDPFWPTTVFVDRASVDLVKSR